MARRFLPALRGTLETKGLAERVKSSATTYAVAGAPYPVHWNVDRAVREGFQANPWVFRAVEVICHTALMRKIVIRQGDPDEGEPMRMSADQTRVLYRLNRRANPWEPAKLWRYKLYAQWLLSSRGVFIEVVRSRSGAIAMVLLLDPDLVEMVPTLDNPIGAFVIRTTGETGGRRDPLPPFDPDNPDQRNSVLWVRSPHPTVLTQGMSPAEVAGLSIDLDRYARLYNRDYMAGGGRPGGVLGLKGSADPPTVDKIQNQFNRRVRPGEIVAITADNMFYQDLSTAPRDMQWGETMLNTKKEVSNIFGVPESMMGDASGRTFDNADAEYGIYLEHRLAPLLALVDDQLDMLTGQAEDDNWLRHDLSDVWVLKRHRRAEEDRYAADLDRGAISMNEYRDFRKLPRIDAAWADMLWIPPQRAAGYTGGNVDLAAAKEAAALPILGQPAAPGGDAGGTPGEPGPQPGNAPDPAALASYNAQTNGYAAGVRAVAANGQGRSPAGGMNALPAGGPDDGAVIGPLELAHALPEGWEGKQGGARDDDPETGSTSTWR